MNDGECKMLNDDCGVERGAMSCRKGCGACCIAPSISSPIPGMPGGKPAGTTCVNLDVRDHTCMIWGGPDYPAVCREFSASRWLCGTCREDALGLLSRLERDTRPCPH
jgi:uncharacterized protein